MEQIGRLIKIIIPAALLIVGFNDLGRYLQAQYQLGTVTADAAIVSADIYKRSGDRTASWRAGESLAEKYQATVYGFDVKNGRVYLWTKMPVAGTWAVHRVSALMDKKPQSTPMNLQAEDMAIIDNISGGRVAYAFGIGHRAEEYEHMGIDERRR